MAYSGIRIERSLWGTRPNKALQSDRFARKIVAFLTSSCATRSRRLNAIPLGRPQAVPAHEGVTHTVTLHVTRACYADSVAQCDDSYGEA